MSYAELCDLKTRHANAKLALFKLENTLPAGKEAADEHKTKTAAAKNVVADLENRIAKSEKEFRS